MMLLPSSAFSAALAFALSAPLFAQLGDSSDKAGTVQPPPPAEWKVPAAPVLSPEAALKSFRLPAGFRIELVASDPLISDPVALDFDAEGRLWVLEMHSYMPDVDGRGENQPVNRVVVLEDTDHDGRMDKRTVYMDGLGLVRAIKVLEHGVLVGEPPNLWFTRDTNGDGRADEKVAIATDFSTAEANPELGANALVWGLDNWIGAAYYGRRFRLQNGKWRESPVVHRGQWGQAMDDYGRLFTTINVNYIRVDLVPAHYPARNPNLVVTNRGAAGSTGVYQLADTEQEVWPIRVNPGVNRGYTDGQLRKDGTLKTFTAVCGPAIYRGDNFPAEFHGNYFVAEPAAHVVRRAVITDDDGMLSSRNAYEGREFLASTDERFRPVNVYSAPDGTLYVVDLYRGLIQHRQYMTSYLRRQILERGLDRPSGRGRIYRVVHETKKAGPAPALTKASAAQLVENLSHPNGWWRDTARRLLVEREDKSVAPQLRTLAAAANTSAPVRLQALWTLEGIGALDETTVARVMEDPAPKLRAAAIRLSEPWLATGNAAALAGVGKHARDPSREVRLQAALSLGEAQEPAAAAILAGLLRAEVEAPFLVPAVVSGLAGRELAFLERLAAAPEWRESGKGRASAFEAVAAAIAQGGDAEKLNRLFALVRSEGQPRWQRVALLNGVRSAATRKLAALPRELELATTSPDAEIARGTGELLQRFIWPGKFGAGPIPPTAAEQQLFEKGRTIYASVCVACHQPDGRGLAGVALPLVDSRWVLGADQALARIVLKGKSGRSGQTMPALEMLSDETLAAALTYIRRSWGHDAPPVLPATIGLMRRTIILHAQPYTDEELATLPVQR